MSWEKGVGKGGCDREREYEWGRGTEGGEVVVVVVVVRGAYDPEACWAGTSTSSAAAGGEPGSSPSDCREISY